MNNEIHMLDVVALTEDIPDHGLRRGQVGTIVEPLAKNVLEVEFVDNEGHTLRHRSETTSQLLVLHYQPA